MWIQEGSSSFFEGAGEGAALEKEPKILFSPWFRRVMTRESQR
jgi:hypothetical protein